MPAENRFHAWFSRHVHDSCTNAAGTSTHNSSTVAVSPRQLQDKRFCFLARRINWEAVLGRSGGATTLLDRDRNDVDDSGSDEE